jgi:hypothetical protein
MEIIHVDVCSSWCEVECGVFSISSMMYGISTWWERIMKWLKLFNLWSGNCSNKKKIQVFMIRS